MQPVAKFNSTTWLRERVLAPPTGQPWPHFPILAAMIGKWFWPHQKPSSRPMMAAARSRSTSFVLATLRALHVDLRLADGGMAAIEESQGLPLISRPGANTRWN